MKTPDEIKKGLEIAVNGCMTCECCITDCPYDLECHPMNEDTNVDMPKQMSADALAYIQQLENHIGELTEKVEQLEATQPKWISVEERLPEPNTIVLLIAHGWEPQLVYIGKLEKVESEKSWLTGLVSKASEWTVYGFSYLREPIVTHWMPLPELPKGENDE